MSWQNQPPITSGIFNSSNSWSGIPLTDHVKGLLTGGVWGENDPDVGNKIDLSYFFLEYEDADEVPYYSHFLYEWMDYEKEATINSMAAFAEVANINFTETNDYHSANISWMSLDSEDIGGEDVGGWAYVPHTDFVQSGHIAINWEFYHDYDDELNPGSYYHNVFVHELGHALGLEHPFESNDFYGLFPGVSEGSPYDSGDNNLNGLPWTVMGYNLFDPDIGLTPETYELSGFLEGLGAFDIAATQYLYGPNTTHNTGNDIYSLNESDLNGWKCIWDNGGTDTISAAFSLQSVNIDLRNASLQNQVGGGGYVSQVGSESKGYTIAYNSTGTCIIENATGSNFNDVLKGNSYANVLIAGDGIDKLFGNAGSDSLLGGNGNDILNGGNDNDILNGGSGNDTLNGGFGNDRLVGGTGNDRLVGGAGIDTAVFSSKANRINLGTTKEQATGDGNDVLIGIENVNGGAGNDVINGSRAGNVLNGGTGADILYGFLGNDRLVGGAGIDTAVFSLRANRINLGTTTKQATGDGNDVLIGIENVNGGAGNDIITGNNSANTLNGGNGNDTLNGGLGNDHLVGGAGIDTAVFSSKANRINLGTTKKQATGDGNDILTGIENVNGGGGNDIITGNNSANTLNGDGGNDTLNGGLGDDRLVGGAGIDTAVFSLRANRINLGTTKEQATGDGNDVLIGIENVNGGAGNDIITGNNSANTLNGGAGNDTLYGRAGNDTLNGGSGIDDMRGGSGNDTYIVDNSSDVVNEFSPSGRDLVLASVTYILKNNNIENLTLTGSSNINGTGNASANIIIGNSGANKLIGGDGVDTLFGNVGNDILNGGSGIDDLRGGAGNDTYIVDNSSDVVRENSNQGIDLVQASVTYILRNNNLENLTLTGSRNINGTGNNSANTIRGNSGSNRLNGGAGVDILFGNAGNDTLNGGSGIDDMRGGAGNDTYIVDNASDVVRENSNQGTDLVKSSSSYILRNNNVENLTLTGSSNINGTGNASSNIIIGNSGANKLIGGDGDDRLDGGGGDDVFRGGRGNDIYYVDGYEDVKEFANQGNDLVISTASFNLDGNIENLTLTGSSNINGTGNNSANTIRGNSGANTLIGFDGLDFLFGNAGNDILYGNAGNDRLNGGYGNDTLYGGIGNDRLIGFTGNNRLFGGNNNDTLMGGVGNDVLHGDAGNDGLFGGSGNDTLNGGNGNDTLSGDKGNDTLEGGEGNDIFWIASGIGRDLILDYENGVDRIQLRNGLVENDLTFSYESGHTRIKDDEGDLLAIVQNTVAADITFI